MNFAPDAQNAKDGCRGLNLSNSVSGIDLIGKKNPVG
jgi:hypothetical protein